MLPHPLVSILLQEIFRLCGFWFGFFNGVGSFLWFIWWNIFLLAWWDLQICCLEVIRCSLDCVRMVSCGSFALFKHFKTKRELCCCCGMNQWQWKLSCKPQHLNLSCTGASSPQTLWFLAFPFLGWLGFFELFSDSLSQEAWPECLLSVLLPACLLQK